jgi:hypothetical protein
VVVQELPRAAAQEGEDLRLLPVQADHRGSGEEAEGTQVKADKTRWSEPSQWFVPRLGTRVRLVEDWEFRLYNEHRNYATCELFGMKLDGYDRDRDVREIKTLDEPVPYGCWRCVTLFKDTVLKVSRVYIKPESKPDGYGLNKGGEYNSLTFWIDTAPDDLVMIDALSGTKIALRNAKGRPLHPKFWAKLRDVNQIRCAVDMDTLATF